MSKEIKIKISGDISQNDKAVIETEIGILDGVIDASVDDKTGEILIEFDSQAISQEGIFEKIERLGYKPEGREQKGTAIQKEHLYFVGGMHCASCEILIEKKLLSLPGVESVEASTNKGTVLMEYEGKKPGWQQLNKIFQKEGYVFSDKPLKTARKEKNGFWLILGISLLIISGFFILNKLGVPAFVNVNSKSSLAMFFVFGVLAGLSSCAALVGGLILSMSKQWLGIYSDRATTFQRFQPHLMFNLGRVVSYGVLGGALGALGSALQISLRFTSALIVIVSIMMVFLALQMLGVRAFRKFQITVPKFVTRYIADESNFQGRYMPFLMGALTFFLPCGFTITAQGLALLSGNIWQGGLIMFFFALGTAPALLAIGFSSIKFSQKPHLSNKFLKVAGFLVLFFAVFNINTQLNVLGLPSFSDVRGYQASAAVKAEVNGLPPLAGGKQVIKMDASYRGYSPNYFKVKAGVPVRWEITDKGTSGCTNAIISRGLFKEEIPLTPNQTSVKEFTPEKPGRYKFSCWMGMVSGVIEVVDASTASSGAKVNGFGPASSQNQPEIPSGASGCGCGGGGGGGGTGSCGT